MTVVMMGQMCKDYYLSPYYTIAWDRKRDRFGTWDRLSNQFFLSVYVSVGKLTVAFFNRSSRNLLDRPWQVLHKGRWMTPEGAWPRSRVLLLKQWDIYPCSTERISCVINYLCLWRCLSRVYRPTSSLSLRAARSAMTSCFTTVTTNCSRHITETIASRTRAPTPPYVPYSSMYLYTSLFRQVAVKQKQ